MRKARPLPKGQTLEGTIEKVNLVKKETPDLGLGSRKRMGRPWRALPTPETEEAKEEEGGDGTAEEAASWRLQVGSWVRETA